MKYCFGISIFILQLTLSVVEASETSKTGLSIDDSRSLIFRFVSQNNHSAEIGVRFGVGHYGSGTSSSVHADSSNVQLVLGYRKYNRNEKIDHFYGASLALSYTGRDGNQTYNNSDSRRASLSGLYGMEYMVTENISIEGRVGIRVNYNDYTDGTNRSRSYTVPETGIAINYYW